MDTVPQPGAVSVSIITICVLAILTFLVRLLWKRDDERWRGKSLDLSAAPTDRKWRIAIVGVMASGKSTLAKELSDMLELQHIDMDEVYWAQGSKVNALDVLDAVRKELKEAIGPAKDGGWVCEGIYKAARTEVWNRADVIVYLDPSPLLRMRRVLQREALYWWHGTPNNIGNIFCLKKLSCWRGIFKILAHASGLDFQQRQLRENLARLHQDVELRYDEYLKEEEEFLRAQAVAAEQSQSLGNEIDDLKQQAHQAKEAGDGATAARCYREIKELSNTLKKVQAAPKPAKLVAGKPPATAIPVLHLWNNADIHRLKQKLRGALSR